MDQVEVFTESVWLQLQTVPFLMLFPPSIGENTPAYTQPIRFDPARPWTAEELHSWIQRQLPPGNYLELSRPLDWSRLLNTVAFIVGAFTFGPVAYPCIRAVVHNRKSWAAVSLVLVLLFTSGSMFNNIRSDPYVPANEMGRGIVYFTGTTSTQTRFETQIIATVCKIALFSLTGTANSLQMLSYHAR